MGRKGWLHGVDLDFVELMQRERAAEWREVDVHVPLVLPHLPRGAKGGEAWGKGRREGAGRGGRARRGAGRASAVAAAGGGNEVGKEWLGAERGAGAGAGARLLRDDGGDEQRGLPGGREQLGADTAAQALDVDHGDDEDARRELGELL